MSFFNVGIITNGRILKSLPPKTPEWFYRFISYKKDKILKNPVITSKEIKVDILTWDIIITLPKHLAIKLFTFLLVIANTIYHPSESFVWIIFRDSIRTTWQKILVKRNPLFCFPWQNLMTFFNTKLNSILIREHPTQTNLNECKLNSACITKTYWSTSHYLYNKLTYKL